MSELQLTVKLRATTLAVALAMVCSASLAAPPYGGVAEIQASIQSLVQGAREGEILLPRPGLGTASQVAALLKPPLTADAAVRIVLLNNPELQRTMGAARLLLAQCL